MSKQGILLDENLSDAFKLMAINEKLCNEKRSSLVLNYANNRRDFINQHKFDILSSLIIFGKIYSNSYSTISGYTERHSILNQPIDFSILHEEDILEFINVQKDDLTKGDLNTSAADFTFLRDLVLECSAHELITNYPHFKFSEKDLTDAYTVILDSISETKNDLEDFFIINLRSYEGLQSPYYDLMLANPQKQPLIESITDSYRNIASTIKSSNSLGIFSKTSIPNLDAQNLFNINNSDEYIQVYKVILEEDVTFPFPQTLKEAISLSKDKNVTHFRNTLQFWVDALKENKLNDLALLRKEIKKAKVDLTKISQLKKIGRIVSYISLPISIASLLLHMPIGILLSPIGPAINLKSFIKEKKYRWLLFGKWK